MFQEEPKTDLFNGIMLSSSWKLYVENVPGYFIANGGTKNGITRVGKEYFCNEE